MALMWESKELIELHKAYEQFLLRKAHTQIVKVALVATISRASLLTLSMGFTAIGFVSYVAIQLT